LDCKSVDPVCYKVAKIPDINIMLSYSVHTKFW
jgi:hypothetical protein